MSPVTVKDIMTPNPVMMRPSQTVKEAAQRMKELDVGILPVGTPDRVVGILTDRDITIRVTAQDKDPSKTKVEEAMTRKIYTCGEEETIEHAAGEMRKHDVSRLIVTKGNRATGIVTMTCLLRGNGTRKVSDEVLHELLGPQKKAA